MKRHSYLKKVAHYLSNYPIVALLGPRQCGKTTLAREYFFSYQKTKLNQSLALASSNYFDLEDSTDLARLKNPKLALEPLTGLIVIDEIQRAPELFTILPVLPKQQRKFLILGSASRELIKQSLESVAGRIAYIELTPFNASEVKNLQTLWLQGGFPLSYLASTWQASAEWREFYITTLLERDIPNLGIQVPPLTLRRFWSMLAHYHGNIFNASEIGRSLGIADTTVRRYLDILSGIFMVRQLQPWQENIKKRQVKSPKIYFRDSGVLHTLLGIDQQATLFKHPKLGASWEGFAIEQVIQHKQVAQHECFFWATHSNAELDLLTMRNNQRTGFEFKYQDAPKLTKSMTIAMNDLKLNQLFVIYPGKKSYKLSEHITVQGLEDCLNIALTKGG